VKIPATKERKFEKNLIEGQKEKYLSTNSWERYLEDAGYREKVNLIRGFLESTSGEGFILDVGANTAGESEILAHLGHRMVPTDVNEIALSYSKIRAKKFRDEELDYYAADAHCLPFAENTFDKIVAFEVLHHMEEIRTVLSELYRVLKPGGHLFTCEPNASNPYRRLSELRDYFRGTHESSFSKRELLRLFEDAGFRIADVGQRVLPPSKWKKDHLSGVRGGLKDLNFAISRRLPRLFGSFVLVARKPGRISATGFSLQSRLLCPITKSPLSAYAGAFISTNETGPKYSYPSHGGIPVLIREDACVWNH
jgi:ubiquinone/menaquinone biosynthesis C-methylase UbiE